MDVKVGMMVKLQERLPRNADGPVREQRQYKTWVTGQVMKLTPKGANVHWKHSVVGKTCRLDLSGWGWYPYDRLRPLLVDQPIDC